MPESAWTCSGRLSFGAFSNWAASRGVGTPASSAASPRSTAPADVALNPARTILALLAVGWLGLGRAGSRSVRLVPRLGFGRRLPARGRRCCGRRRLRLSLDAGCGRRDRPRHGRGLGNGGGGSFCPFPPHGRGRREYTLLPASH